MRYLVSIVKIMVIVVVFACSSSEEGGSSSGGNSGINVADYQESATIGPEGGSVSIPSGPSLSAPSGSLDQPCSIGIRPAKNPPATPTGWQSLTEWYDIGVTKSDINTKTTPLELSIPVVPPPGAESHPGLKMLARVLGVVVVLDGKYDPTTGRFVVKLLGLPPTFTISMAYNPNMKRLMTYPAQYGALQGSVSSALESGWPTIEWVIDYDGQTITDDEASAVLDWARSASKIYSDAGLLPPFLYKEMFSDGERWYLHLIASGSNYDPATDKTSTDLARHFGRLNLAVEDIRLPITNEYGGGASTVAHELFHAVFESYNIPYICFDLVIGGVAYCYPSNSGFNEGLATTIGYALEQGEVKPRPNPPYTTLERPHGYCNSLDMVAAYQNQDFYVYMLRMGSLNTVKQYLTALTKTNISNAHTTFQALAAYAKALDENNTGFPDPFHKVYALYAVDRAYIRTQAGHIWPDEPDPENPGLPNTFAPSLFPNKYVVQSSDCRTTSDEFICEVTLKDVPPLAARALLLEMTENVPPNIQMAEMVAKVRADASGGQVSLWVFGEKDGLGSDEGRVGSIEGSEVTLKGVMSKWNMAKIIVVHGASPTQDIKVTMTMKPADISGACSETADWMCKCQSAGAGYGCVVYEYAVNQMCANQSEMSCEEFCAEMNYSYAAAYNDPDPATWNAMCPNNPR